MQLPNDKPDFYETVYVPRGGMKNARKRYVNVRAAASVLLCAAASYMAGGVIAADTTTVESGADAFEASYVMSYVDDYETYVETDAADDMRIRELADEYISEHTR